MEKKWSNDGVRLVLLAKKIEVGLYLSFVRFLFANIKYLNLTSKLSFSYYY